MYNMHGTGNNWLSGEAYTHSQVSEYLKCAHCELFFESLDLLNADMYAKKEKNTESPDY